MTAPWFSQMFPQLKVKTLVGVLDIVGDGFQDTFGEELLVSTDNDVSLSMSIKIFLKLGGINRLVGLSIETVPTQDVIASASDEDIPQQVGEVFLSLLNLAKVRPQVGGINW